MRADVQAPARPTRVPPLRLGLLLMAGVAALFGLDAALLNLGLTAPATSVSLADAHGVLMVYGFLGTAITLERAVALQSGPATNSWAFASPLLSGVGTVMLLLETTALPMGSGRLLPGLAWTASMAILVGIYAAVWGRQPSYAVLVQLLGAVAGAAGAALWTRGLEAATIVAWWASFLILTILGERLELARIAFLRRGTEQRIVAEACATLVALTVTLVAPASGYPLLGLCLAVMIVDTATFDVARRTIRSTGLPRFMAACLLAGYAWALLAALVWMIAGPTWSGYRYDLVVHSLTIGFAVSMIMAHAPIIVPALIRRPLAYHPALWAVWGLLQFGLVVRMVSGARSAEAAWRFGGALDVVALLAFLITTVTLVTSSTRKRQAADVRP